MNRELPLRGLALALALLPGCRSEAPPAVERFAQRVEEGLAAGAVGWAYEIRFEGEIARSACGGFAVAPVDDPDGRGAPFTLDTRMHVASMSKLITNLAAAHCAARHGLTLDEPLARHLPSAWTVHPSLAGATLADALNMLTGIGGGDDAAACSFDSLQQLVAAGADPERAGQFDYRNASYALFRLVVPYLDGYVEPADRDPEAIDRQTAEAFVAYANWHLLGPAGIEPAGCAETGPEPVRMYAHPFTGRPGTFASYRAPDAGETDLTRVCGGFGWHLSVREVGALVDTAFRSEHEEWRRTVELGSSCFPLRPRSAEFGAYRKFSGSWNRNLRDGDQEWTNGLLTCALVLPGGLQIVAFSNSPVGDEPNSLEALVLAAYTEALAASGP